ncbi:MAG: hypothetical protein NTV31_07890 [Bacteroidia bacterium]|nr:hypothetical protein [Bacteroidia bacterium]
MEDKSIEKVSISRIELYEMVWKEPLVSLSRKYSISDNELRKICKKMKIPLPPNGYWQKIRYGKHVQITKLPSYDGEREISLYIRDKQEINMDPYISPHKRLKMEILRDLKPFLEVPERLSSPDKLIMEARDCLNDNNRNHSRHSGMLSTRSGYLTIRVSKDNIGRALRFMDTLLKLLRERDHIVENKYDTTYIIINGQKIEVSLKEKLKRVEVPTNYSWVYHEYRPTGILTFRIEGYHMKIWEDGKELLENKLADILAYLELKAAKMREEWLYYEEQRKIREAKELIEKEIKARKEKEIRDFNKLVKEANQWNQTQIIRSYISYVEDKALECDELTDDLRHWIDWSKQKADWYDPIKKKEDSILGLFDEQICK